MILSNEKARKFNKFLSGFFLQNLSKYFCLKQQKLFCRNLFLNRPGKFVFVAEINQILNLIYILLYSRKQIADSADVALALHFFFGERGSVLDSGETQTKFVRIRRAAQGFFESDKSRLVKIK